MEMWCALISQTSSLYPTYFALLRWADLKDFFHNCVINSIFDDPSINSHPLCHRMALDPWERARIVRRALNQLIL